MINESDNLSEPGVRYGDWAERYSEIMYYLHGRSLIAVLEDDPDYYYEGRFSINDWKSNPDRSTITVNYVVSPYKKRITTSVEGWAWDSFNFNSGKIIPVTLKDIRLNNDQVTVTITAEERGSAPTCPVVIVSDAGNASISVTYGDDTYALVNGTHVLRDVVLYGKEDSILYCQGIGKISIVIREGRL